MNKEFISQSPLKVVFMGTPNFSVNPLRVLIDSIHNIEAVYTQPPRKSGRGMKKNNSPVHTLALHNNIPVITPLNFSEESVITSLREISPDIIIVSAYGIILPKDILNLPRFGCLNIHASILPRWRGAAPIQRSMMAGDKFSGISFMVMDEGLDTGSVISKFEIPINYKHNAGFLHDELSSKASSELINTINQYVNGFVTAIPQNNSGVTYASKIMKDESRLDWLKTSKEIFFTIRALNPFPGTWFKSNLDKRIKIIDAVEDSLSGKPGEVLDSLIIACGENSLKILAVQPEGGNQMSVDDFLRGNPIKIGSILR
jgi:methionyl-tRNA formyltransferase